MFRWTSAVLVLWCIATPFVDACAQTRNPTRFVCHAAKNLAVVGAWDGDGVLVVERVQDQECRFSINGTPAGTPPLERVVAGWDFIRNGGFASSANFPVEPLAYALSAAAPYESLAPGLREDISKNSGTLLNCFGARDAGTSFEYTSANFTCKVISQPQGGLLRVEGSVGVEYLVGPGIQLAIRAANTVHYLFMPLPPRR
jgi:hypothetical protein